MFVGVFLSSDYDAESVQYCEVVGELPQSITVTLEAVYK